MYRKSVRVLNDIFLFFCIFCILFVWVQYAWRNFWATTLLCLPISGLAFWAIKAVSNKKQDKKEQTSKDIKLMENASKQFAVAAKKDLFFFFRELLCKQYTEVKETPKGIEFLKDGQKYLLVPLYSSFLITERDLLPLLQIKNHKILAVCKSFSKESGDLVAMFSERLELWDEEKVYNKLLKPNDLYPSLVKIEEKKVKRDYRQIIFAKEKAKPYFLSGLVLLLSSFFVRYNIYYVIVSSVLFFVSMYCLLYKKKAS